MTPKGKWYCGDCEKLSLVENLPHGGQMIHCCFYCGSSYKRYEIEPILFPKPKTLGDIWKEMGLDEKYLRDDDS